MPQLTRLRQRPDVDTCVFPDGTCLLFDSRQGKGYTLNIAGALVWDYCDGTMTTEQIAIELANLLPEHPEVRAETERMLTELAEYGLLWCAVDGSDHG